MIPNNYGILVCRFGEKRWITRMLDGEVSFSCAGAFIDKAKQSGNSIQGDLYEGVFARVRRNDYRIEKMEKEIGSDLEIIDDNEYLYLRRKSSKYVPIFCYYTITPAVLIKEIKQKNNNAGLVRIRHDFETRMFEGFADTIKIKNVVSDDYQFCCASMRADSFVNRIKVALNRDNLTYRMDTVDYDLKREEEFFIKPTWDYKELLSKLPEYEYQCETRIILPKINFSSISERYNLNIMPMLKDKDYHLNYDFWYSVFNAEVSFAKSK